MCLRARACVSMHVWYSPAERALLRTADLDLLYLDLTSLLRRARAHLRENDRPCAPAGTLRFCPEVSLLSAGAARHGTARLWPQRTGERRPGAALVSQPRVGARV